MNDIDINQAQSAMSKAYYEWYWMCSGAIVANQSERVEKILEYRRLRSLLDLARDEVNARGNPVYRDVCADRRLGFRGTCRYTYDLNLVTWRQYDTTQDAEYFGIWVDSKTRRIMTYCEGDRILVVCPTARSFRAELAHMNAFYGEAPPAFRIIHPEGDMELIYDPRPDGTDATDDPIAI